MKDETKQRISETMKTLKKTPEHKAKISASCKGRFKGAKWIVAGGKRVWLTEEA